MTMSHTATDHRLQPSGERTSSRSANTHRPTGLAPDTVPGYDSSREVVCFECSHDDCVHYHSAQRRLSRVEAQGFLRYTENTLFTKHSRGEMPQAVSGPPLEFSTCQLAVFKYDDGLILSGRAYDRDAHLGGIPAARAARAKREAAKRAKLSAAMRRRHAARNASSRPANARVSKHVAARRAVRKGGAR